MRWEATRSTSPPTRAGGAVASPPAALSAAPLVQVCTGDRQAELLDSSSLLQLSSPLSSPPSSSLTPLSSLISSLPEHSPSERRVATNQLGAGCIGRARRPRWCLVVDAAGGMAATQATACARAWSAATTSASVSASDPVPALRSKGVWAITGTCPGSASSNGVMVLSVSGPPNGHNACATAA